MKKNRQRETTALRKGEFFKCERIFVHFARFCLLFRERERERKRKTKKTHFTPAKSVRLVVLPCFLLLDSFEYLLKREIHQHDRRSAKRTTRGRGEEECD